MKLKEQIFERNGISVNEQRLMWAGKQLIDDRTVKSYGIEDDATIFLVLRLKGGSDRYKALLYLYLY